MTASARILAAVALLDPRPGEHLLEIGCGTGQAIEAILSRRPDVRVTAVDRSGTAVKRARTVNAGSIAASRTAVSIGDIEAGPLPAGRFDRIFAIRVNSFWTRPGVALPRVAGVLAAGGELWMIYDAPAEKVFGPIEASLSAFGTGFARRTERPGAFAIVARFD
jgi:SAM-dependent methyltransferase